MSAMIQTNAPNAYPVGPREGMPEPPSVVGRVLRYTAAGQLVDETGQAQLGYPSAAQGPMAGTSAGMPSHLTAAVQDGRVLRPSVDGRRLEGIPVIPAAPGAPMPDARQQQLAAVPRPPPAPRMTEIPPIPQAPYQAPAPAQFHAPEPPHQSGVSELIPVNNFLPMAAQSACSPCLMAPPPSACPPVVRRIRITTGGDVVQCEPTQQVATTYAAGPPVTVASYPSGSVLDMQPRYSTSCPPLQSRLCTDPCATPMSYAEEGASVTVAHAAGISVTRPPPGCCPMVYPPPVVTCTQPAASVTLTRSPEIVLTQPPPCYPVSHPPPMVTRTHPGASVTVTQSPQIAVTHSPHSGPPFPPCYPAAYPPPMVTHFQPSASVTVTQSPQITVTHSPHSGCFGQPASVVTHVQHGAVVTSPIPVVRRIRYTADGEILNLPSPRYDCGPGLPMHVAETYGGPMSPHSMYSPRGVPPIVSRPASHFAPSEMQLHDPHQDRPMGPVVQVAENVYHGQLHPFPGIHEAVVGVVPIGGGPLGSPSFIPDLGQGPLFVNAAAASGPRCPPPGPIHVPRGHSIFQAGGFPCHMPIAGEALFGRRVVEASCREYYE